MALMSVKKLSKTYPMSSLNTQGKKIHEQKKELVVDLDSYFSC